MRVQSVVQATLQAPRVAWLGTWDAAKCGIARTSGGIAAAHGAAAVARGHRRTAVPSTECRAASRSGSGGSSGASSTARQTPPLPEPAPHQQTLRRSFTVGGVGLHTGEYTHVRVLPAFAGEGRYFVKVAPGTASSSWEVEQPAVRQLEELGPSSGPMAASDARGDWNAKLFFEFVESQEEGSFTGTFADYLQQRGTTLPDTLLVDAELELLPEEEPSIGQAGEDRLAAHAHNLQQGHRWCSVLAQGGADIWGAEHLLAALECCGVDNARIEVEGGREIPIVDGSALGWAAEIQRAGLRLAPSASVADGASTTTRSIPALTEVVTVQDGESFIAYYPGPHARISVGVDRSEDAPVIGRQWFTWSPEDAGYSAEDHFRWVLAPARTVFSSVEAMQAIAQEGLLLGGPDYVSLVASKDEWVDPTMVRFPTDEAARHALVDLLGDLSLLAAPGGRGLPSGHIVAYQATHALQATFIKQLQLALENCAARA